MKSSSTASFPEQSWRRSSTATTWWRPPRRPGVRSFLPQRLPGSLCFWPRLRRFFDIQAGSAWRDLSAVLPSLRGTVLDVGCGAQPFRSLVNPQATYLGIDTDAAKAHFGYEMPNTTYFSGDVWPVADCSVNVVLCTETLEHVLETRRFLAEAARCLAPGGMLLLTVPFAARWHFIPYDYWRFTPSSLNHLLTAAGFHSVRVYARGNALYGRLLQGHDPSPVAPDATNRIEAVGLLLRLGGLVFLPLFVLLAVVANLSLLGSRRRRLPRLYPICGSRGSPCGCS